MADKTVQSIQCDACGEELVVDSMFPHRWGIVVSPRDFGINSSNCQYLVVCHPPIDRDFHFCGLDCLGRWLNRFVKPGRKQAAEECSDERT